MKTALFTAGLLLVFSNATAQDLQFRTVIQADIPGMSSGDLPQRTMTMSIKGSKMRIDTEMVIGKADPPALPDVMVLSAIIDRAAGKMFAILHEEKAYTEQDFKMPAFDVDSAKQAAMSQTEPAFKETGDTATINGYKTKRFLMSMELPFNPMPGANADGRFLMVMEHWGANDSVLVEAYRVMQAMSPTLTGNNANPAMVADMMAKVGFPVRTTTMMVSLADSAAADVEKILRAGAGAEGLQMRMRTEIKDIKTGPLDASLFEVPKDYKKQ